MRDALSILDKIVSFTNGEVNYSNTLEHLNILDEDYYFKLLANMQQQQLSEALLLYDEINQKGFEGDTLLEGFAEFIRNLLVSKDTKAAILLEVADDFKQKYLEAAKNISTGWLIAALNILNDAGINYKQARNKRLHVELALIKLSYVAQAIELVGNDAGLSKKKLTDTAKSVAFRALPILRVKEEEPAKPIAKATTKTETGAKLIIEEVEQSAAPVQKQNPAVQSNTTQSTKPAASLASLQKIRQKVSDQQKNGNNEVKPLTEEELYVAWGAFIEKLAGKKNHSAVTNFKMAVLKVIDNNTIEIVTGNNIQQKFIEQERAALVDHLQNHFKNRQLIYSVIIVETEVQETSGEKPLNTREQYLRIIEEYPLVKELKDRLRLELDY